MKRDQIAKWQAEASVGQDLWDKSAKQSIPGLHLRKNAKSLVWRYFYRDAAGKRHFVKIGTFPSITLEEARKVASKISVDIASGNDPVQKKQEAKLTANNTAQKYLDSVYSKVLLTKKSGTETKQIFSRHFSKLMSKPMSELSARDVTAWQSWMIESGRAFSTQKRSYGAFKTLLNDAVKRGYLESNPLDKVTLDKVLKSDSELLQQKTKRTALTKEQISQLMIGLDLYQEEKRKGRRNSRVHGQPHLLDLDTVEYVDHVKPFILTMFYTGFRNGDVINLRWENIHFNPSATTIHKTISKTQHKDEQAKTFPVPPPLEYLLSKWCAQQGNPKTGFVFESTVTGGMLNKKAMTRPWIKIKKLAGLPEDLQLYSLRHNFASWLVMQGTDLLTVAKLMGHKDIKMIVDHYGHLQPNTAAMSVSNAFASMFNE